MDKKGKLITTICLYGSLILTSFVLLMVDFVFYNDVTMKKILVTLGVIVFSYFLGKYLLKEAKSDQDFIDFPILLLLFMIYAIITYALWYYRGEFYVAIPVFCFVFSIIASYLDLDRKGYTLFLVIWIIMYCRLFYFVPYPFMTITNLGNVGILII